MTTTDAAHAHLGRGRRRGDRRRLAVPVRGARDCPIAAPISCRRRGVTRGPLKLTVYATGELRAGRTATLVVPPAGGTLRLVTLVSTGNSVKTGDVVFEIRSGRPAVRARAGQVGDGRGRAADRQDQGGQRRAGRRGRGRAAHRALRRPARRARHRGQRSDRRHRRAEERAHARGSAAQRLAQLEQDVKSRTATNEAALAVLRRAEATRRSWRCSARSRSSTAWWSRRRSTAWSPRRKTATPPAACSSSGRRCPSTAQGDTTFSGRADRRRDRDRPDGSARQDQRDRSRQPARPASSRPWSPTRLPGETFTAQVGALSGLASRGNFFETSAGAPVRRHLHVRQAGPAAARRRRRSRLVIDGQGGPQRAAGAAPGGLREERQDLRLPEGRRPLRAARREGHRQHREPRRASTGV